MKKMTGEQIRAEIKRLASRIESLRDGVVSHIFAMQTTEAALRSLIIKVQELDITEVSNEQ